MKKIVLIMGAGVYQVPLIKKVKELGHKVIVVSPFGNYTGLAIADEVINLDTRDYVGVLEHARRIGIDAVLTTGTDVAVPTIGYLIDELGLNGTQFKPAQWSMDKSLMKQRFVKYGVNTAKFVSVDNFENLRTEAIAIGYPVMVKAIDSSGSRGITQALSESDLSSAYKSALSVSESDSVIVEKFLEGVEIGAQAIVVGNEVVEVFLHSDKVTPPPISAPIGHAMPLDLEKNVEVKTKQLVKKAVMALEIKDTISNVDIMIVNDEPFILEVGARMGATCLPENISIYAGFDAYEFIIRLSLGEKPSLPKTYKKQANAAILLKVSETGRVKNVFVPESTLNHPNVIDLTIDVKKGDLVKTFEVGPDRVGHIIVKAETLEEANILVENLASTVIIEV